MLWQHYMAVTMFDTERVLPRKETQCLTKKQVGHLGHHHNNGSHHRWGENGFKVLSLFTEGLPYPQLDCLSEHTGWISYLLSSCSSVDDEATLQLHVSGDAIDFFPEVLGKDPWELTHLFEQWNCKHETSKWISLPSLQYNLMLAGTRPP